MRTAGLVCLALWLASVEALANGVNPPKPAGASVVRAECIGKQGAPGLEIYRAQVKRGSDVYGFLQFRGGAGTEEVPLRGWSSVRGLDGKRDKSGFVRVEAKRSDGSAVSKGAIRVAQAGSEIELVGFSKTGTRVGVELSKCAELLVSSVSSNPSTAAGSGVRRD